MSLKEKLFLDIQGFHFILKTDSIVKLVDKILSFDKLQMSSNLHHHTENYNLQMYLNDF